MSLEVAAERLLLADAELEAKGYTPAQARAAVKRARRAAQEIAGRLPADIRERAYAALLEQELAQAEQWIARVVAQGGPTR